ncbi:hypothetical protein Drose_28085 [Dactylosporangium roseum]|uniref:DUF6745 domain-containing protein n=1 Tax=Dactylosporangium roseum TaxID=47989 RepID=A0ABY5ZI88_9ACTN|nr:hypothetical protein Drose_28085 [Dactylosporangium roseum]
MSRAAALGAVSAKWLAAGLSTAPADRDAAADAVRLAYRSAGLPEPARIVWFASPSAGARAAALLTGRRDLPGGPEDKDRWDEEIAADLRAQGCPPRPGTAGVPVRAAVRNRPWAAARAEVYALLGPDGWAGLWSACGADVWRLVNDRVAAPLRAHLRTELPSQARAVLLDAVGGQHDAGWLAAFDAAASGAAGPSAPDTGTTAPVAGTTDRGGGTTDRGGGTTLPWPRSAADDQPAARGGAGSTGPTGNGAAATHGIDDAAGLDPAARGAGGAVLHAVQRLAGLAGVARSAGWWWPYANVAILTDRPDALHRDNIGRLHAADMPALRYSDGFALHAWRGMPIPSDVVDRLSQLTSDQITTERNAELRRVMLEHFGYERYLRAAGAQRIGQDACGVLWRLSFADDEPLTMVEVVNSTPEPDGTSRVYWLRVPPWTRTAREGVAWTFGLTEQEYRPLVET